jgi:glycosyltransferase involved in cell wall biosynthesis
LPPSDSSRRITVISPALNAMPFYPAWLQSIQAQQWENLEVLLIDDGSGDHEALFAAAQSGPPFVKYLRQENRGPAAARNMAIRVSCGDYLAFLDLDDRWAPGHLHRLASALDQDSAAGIAQGLIRKFLADPGGDLYYCSDPYRFVNLGSALFHRDVFDRCGLFDESLRFGEDFDFIIRCWEQGIRKIDVPAVSLLYHRHDGNMTNQKSIIDLGAVQVYKRRLDRMRAQLVDLEIVRARGVSFPDYIGRTVGPFDEGTRERVEV